MLAQEFNCFATKFARVRSALDLELESHNIIADPHSYQDLWKKYDAVLVGGSGDYGCVNNSSDWFRRFCDVLRDIVERERPLFCSCFGHQALAVALGGAVSTDRSKAELGTLEVQLNEEGLRDPLLKELPTPFSAQFGHNDFVSQLPEGAVNLASTPLCAVQAYRLEKKLVYATQFHPELSYLENQERAVRYGKVYDPDLIKPERLKSLFRPSDPSSELLPRFLELARRS